MACNANYEWSYVKLEVIFWGGENMVKRIMDILVPPKYDFYGMLIKQAAVTAEGVELMAQWLSAPTTGNFTKLMNLVDEADVVRMRLEEDLIQAFSTPFDRQDIYILSVQMDRILELAKSTAIAVETYDVKPNQMFIAMARYVALGMGELSKATTLLEKDPKEAEGWIDKMRQANVEVANCYRMALAEAFRCGDAMEALKQREVYNELRDASSYMDLTIDNFHKIIVRVV